MQSLQLKYNRFILALTTVPATAAAAFPAMYIRQKPDVHCE